ARTGRPRPDGSRPAGRARARSAPGHHRPRGSCMDFGLTPEQEELRARAAAFVNDDLIPLELEAERAGGRLAPEGAARGRRRAQELHLNGGNHAVEHGGQGWSVLEQTLVHEELGRNTNAVWWAMDGGYNVLSLGTPAQIERYLLPTMRGERS